MKIAIHPEMIVRIPQFPMEALLENEWIELKESIAISSPDFYSTIKYMKFSDLKTANPAIVHSVWKYFNRAKHRATPYGSFAGFGMLKHSSYDTNISITVPSNQVLHKFISWDYLLDAEFRIDLYDNDTLLFSNSTYYEFNGNIRYVSFDEGKFQLSEVEGTTLILDILALCQFPKSVKDLQSDKRISNRHQGLLSKMIKAQLIFTNKQPNIIGDDYFQKLQIKKEDKPLYLIAERKIISGAVDRKVFKHLPGMVNVLASITKDGLNEDLASFINRFQTKFESRQIPIMIALDPELGVAYGNIAEVDSNDGLVTKFSNKRETLLSSNKDQDQRAIILNYLTHPSGNAIDLEQVTPKAGNNWSFKIANSISALCSVVDGQIIIDQLGGASANALSGRFSLASNEVASFCRNIATMEQGANPDVLFFDIAYMAEYNVDNVNRRQKIYPYQLSILNFDTSDHPLTLDDIYLSVDRGEIMLYSKKLQKRLVPRLASAYNYARSDLSLFRLLCDIQGQGLATNLFINPTTLLPGLKFYPRIQYHNIILSAARWKVALSDLPDTAVSDPLAVLKGYLNDLGLGNNVLTRSGDRTLLFDINDGADLEALYFELRKYRELFIEEGFKSKRSHVVDESGQAYACQFLLALTHGQEIYKGMELRANNDVKANNTQAIFVPGSEWLYYEIFTHPIRTDDILHRRILEFTKQHKKDISCWFFIRYNQGGDHLRFRMRIKRLERIPAIITAMSEFLLPEVLNGIISDFSLKTYKRETERYGSDLIEKVEFHFNKDSKYVLLLLKNSIPIMVRYRLCVDLCLRLRQTQLFSIEKFEKVIAGISNSLLKEHQAIAADYKLLNNEFKIFRNVGTFRLNKTIEDSLSTYEKSLNNILSTCPVGRRGKLLADMVHMHINRLFNSDQRTHEMIIYYFLLKEIAYLKSMAIRA